MARVICNRHPTRQTAGINRPRASLFISLCVYIIDSHRTKLRMITCRQVCWLHRGTRGREERDLGAGEDWYRRADPLLHPRPRQHSQWALYRTSSVWHLGNERWRESWRRRSYYRGPVQYMRTTAVHKNRNENALATLPLSYLYFLLHNILRLNLSDNLKENFIKRSQRSSCPFDANDSV